MATPADSTLSMTRTMIRTNCLNRSGKLKSILFGPFSNKNMNQRKLCNQFKKALQCLDFDTSITASNDHLAINVFRVSVIGKCFLCYQLKLKCAIIHDQDIVSLHNFMKYFSEIGEKLSDKRKKLVDALFPRLVSSFKGVLESVLEDLVYLEEPHFVFFLGLILLLVISLVRYRKKIDCSKQNNCL